MLRSDALTTYHGTYAALGNQPRLLIWGTDDTEVSFEHVDFIRSHAANVSLDQIEGAGHGLLMQRKDEVNRKIIEFLQNSATQDSKPISENE